MSAFQITIYRLDHEGGTKQYHLVLAVNRATKKALAIARWGKTGEWGQVMVEKGDEHDSVKFVNGKLAQKSKRGYRVGQRDVLEAKDLDELRSHLGDYWWKLSGAPLTHLTKGADIADLDPDLMAPAEREAHLAEEERIKAKVAQLTPESTAANPNWGLF